MGGDEIEIPIYLITGFLESGKTTFINFTVAQDYFQIDEPTLLITTEEGEVEYDEKELLKYNTVLEVVESQEQFTPEYLKKLKRRYNPERVILEYNPLWSVKKLEHRAGNRDRRRKLFPDLYAEHEIYLHGNVPACGYGNVQPLPSAGSSGVLPPEHQGGESRLRCPVRRRRGRDQQYL